jgi:hypothetical protein
MCHAMTGYVDYVNKTYALSHGFINTSSHSAYIGVDHTSVPSATDDGRKSVRMESTRRYNGDHLFVFSMDHMPTTSGSLPSGCGLWPSLW